MNHENNPYEAKDLSFRDNETAALYATLDTNFQLEMATARAKGAAAVTTAEREALEQRLVGLERGWHVVRLSFGLPT